MMSGRLHRVCLCGAVLAAVFVVPVLADEGSSATGSTDNTARLEAMLEAQQKKIEALEQQVVAAQQQDVDRSRVEQMKQQIREVLSEQEFRESLMASTVQAGYDKGFYIRSSDEKFTMKINGLFQFRWTYYGSQKDNRYLAPGYRKSARAGFDWSRLRLAFSGNVYSKDLTYYMEFDSSQSNGLNTRVIYAWLNYRFVDEFQMKFGTFRPASTRADVGSTSQFQLVEYPTMNAVFGGGIGTGVRAWGQLFGKRVEYYVDAMNSWGSSTTQTITNDEDYYTNGHDTSPAIWARVVWHALTGACSNGSPAVNQHFDTLSDIDHHTEPALDFGMHYGFKDDQYDGSLRIPYPRRTFFRQGGFGLTDSEGLQINQFGVDAAFKWQGFSITGEYALRILDVRDGQGPPYTPLFQLTGDDSTNVQHGGYVQAGYFLPIPGLENKIEAVARVGGVSTLSGGQEGTWDYGGGLNYFIQGNKVKLQADVTKVSEVPISNSSYSLANVNDDALIWRLQLQVAF